MTVKELRAKLKLTQPEMAKALHVSTGAVQHLENGRMKLSKVMSERIKSVFSVDIAPDEKAPAKKATVKKPAAKQSKKPATKKTAKKPAEKPAVKNATATGEVVIQSPIGGEISTKEILQKIPKNVDKVYVRVDQNKLWWVRGQETGSVDIW